jgi:outer membrane lipoprotein-sorting protein
MRMRRLLACLLLLLLPAAAPPSTPAPPPIDELMARLATVQERRAAFTEEKRIAALTGPVESRGWLVYRRPSHLEKTTTAPRPESLMVDGDQLSVLEEGQAPVLIDLASQPAARALVDAVRATLAGDLATLRRSYDVAMTGTLAGWTLALTPRDPAITGLLRGITVEGAGIELRTVRIEQADGDASVMTISPAA